jgi:hypothetical protein
MDYGNGIILTENFVSYDDAMTLIGWIDKNISNFHLYEFQNNPKRHAIRYGKDQVFWDTSPHEIRGIEGIEDLVKTYFSKVTETLAEMYQSRKKLYVNSFWLAKQQAGAMVKPHHDSHTEMNPQFTHSIICYLNANQIGGELEFPELDVVIKAPGGSMVSFISQGENLLHEVREITQDRYTMLFWLTDQPEFEVKFHSDVCRPLPLSR